MHLRVLHTYLAQFTVYCIFLKTSYMQGRDTCTGSVMKIRTAVRASVYSTGLFPNVLTAVSVFQGPTIGVRNALVAGNHPLAAFFFLHPECDGKR